MSNHQTALDDAPDADDVHYDHTPTQKQMDRYECGDLQLAYRNVSRVLADGPATFQHIRNCTLHCERQIAWVLASFTAIGITVRSAGRWELSQ